MKRLLILTFVLIGITMQAQISKFRVTHAALYTTEWTDWQSSDILIDANYAEKRITIYSQKPQKYDVIIFENEVKEGDTSQFTLLCSDADGLLCLLKFVFFDGRIQLYVHYNNVSWVYELKPLE